MIPGYDKYYKLASWLCLETGHLLFNARYQDCGAKILIKARGQRPVEIITAGTPAIDLALNVSWVQAYLNIWIAGALQNQVIWQ